MENKPIIFQGMCYSGKSTLGKITADILGVPFLDSIPSESSSDELSSGGS